MKQPSTKVYALVLKYTTQTLDVQSDGHECEESVSILFYEDRESAEKRSEETKKAFISPGFSVKSTIIECEQFDQNIGVYALEFAKHLN